MKNTIQAHRHRSASPSRRQAKPPTQKIVTIIFFSTEDGSELFRADFPRPFFNIIQQASKQLGISLDKFFHLAIENKIKNSGIKIAPRHVKGGAK